MACIVWTAEDYTKFYQELVDMYPSHVTINGTSLEVLPGYKLVIKVEPVVTECGNWTPLKAAEAGYPDALDSIQRSFNYDDTK